MVKAPVAFFSFSITTTRLHSRDKLLHGIMKGGILFLSGYLIIRMIWLMILIMNEAAIIRRMITIYCSDCHGTNGQLCPECRTLLNYSQERLNKCPLKPDNPVCAKCRIHCYNPEKREAIRKVMRYSGPRMIYKDPLGALQYLLRKMKNIPRTALLIALFLFSAGLISAGGESIINPYLDYEAFPPGGAAEDFIGKKVSFTGKISMEINQHMLRGQGDRNYIQECYIDPDDRYRYLSQLVGYNVDTLPFDWTLYEDEHLRFYGTFGSISGPPKSAGSKVDETYTELYFDIVDIEILPD